MGRKKIESEQKRKRIAISMDKSIYFYLKEHKIKVSTYINQMLKVATGLGSTGYTPHTTYTNQSQTHNLESASPNLVRGILLNPLLNTAH